MDKEYLRVWNEGSNFNYHHPEMNTGTMLALIGYLEIVKRDLVQKIKEIEE